MRRKGSFLYAALRDDSQRFWGSQSDGITFAAAYWRLGILVTLLQVLVDRDGYEGEVKVLCLARLVVYDYDEQSLSH